MTCWSVRMILPFLLAVDFVKIDGWNYPLRGVMVEARLPREKWYQIKTPKDGGLKDDSVSFWGTFGLFSRAMLLDFRKGNSAWFETCLFYSCSHNHESMRMAAVFGDANYVIWGTKTHLSLKQDYWKKITYLPPNLGKKNWVIDGILTIFWRVFAHVRISPWRRCRVCPRDPGVGDAGKYRTNRGPRT